MINLKAWEGGRSEQKNMLTQTTSLMNTENIHRHTIFMLKLKPGGGGQVRTKKHANSNHKPHEYWTKHKHTDTEAANDHQIS